jgi:hypothetical protein
MGANISFLEWIFLLIAGLIVYNLLWSVLIAIGFIIFAESFDNNARIQPNHRRIFTGLFGFALAGVYGYGLLKDADFAIPALLKVLLWGLGGAILIGTVLWPQPQNDDTDDIGWALVFGLSAGLVLGLILFKDSEWLQLTSGLVMVPLGYISRRIRGRSLSQRRNDQY